MNNNNNNIFGIIGAEISSTNTIWRIDVVEIAEGGIENSSYSNNANDNDNNNNNSVVIQSMYRFVDISTGGGWNSSGSATTSTNGSRTLPKSKLSLSTINTIRDESLQRYAKQ